MGSPKSTWSSRIAKASQELKLKYRQGESTGWNNSQTDVRSLRDFFFVENSFRVKHVVLNTIDRSSNTWTIESNRFTCGRWQWQMWLLRMPGFTCPFTSVLWLQDWSSFQSQSQTYLQRIIRIRRIWFLRRVPWPLTSFGAFFNTWRCSPYFWGQRIQIESPRSAKHGFSTVFFRGAYWDTRSPSTEPEGSELEPQTEWSNMMNSRKNRMGPHQRTPFCCWEDSSTKQDFTQYTSQEFYLDVSQDPGP